MEHYFSVAKINIDEQFDIAVMYLSSDVKLCGGQGPRRN
jgi:hypothetical protein